MLDTVGLTYDDVNRRYPADHQIIGYDLLLDYDGTYKPKVSSSFKLAVDSIIELLMMRPGQYPSIPELGININQYLHDYVDQPGITDEIYNKLIDQCNRIMLVGLNIEIHFDKTEEGIDALIVDVSGTEYVGSMDKYERVIIGISYDKLNRLYARTYYV